VGGAGVSLALESDGEREKAGSWFHFDLYCSDSIVLKLCSTRIQCSQRPRGPIGPGGWTAKSPGLDQAVKDLLSSSAKSKNGRY